MENKNPRLGVYGTDWSDPRCGMGHLLERHEETGRWVHHWPQDIIEHPLDEED